MHEWFQWLIGQLFRLSSNLRTERPGSSGCVSDDSVKSEVQERWEKQMSLSPDFTCPLVGVSYLKEPLSLSPAQDKLRASASFAFSCRFGPCQHLRRDWHCRGSVGAKRVRSDTWAARANFVLRAFGSNIYRGSEGRVSY